MPLLTNNTGYYFLRNVFDFLANILSACPVLHVQEFKLLFTKPRGELLKAYVILLFIVSTKTCEKNILEGDSCIIVPNQIGQKIDANKVEIKWTFTSSSSSFMVRRKNGENLKTSPDATIESDGSLKLQNVNLNNTGNYTFETYDNEDNRLANHEGEITVYGKRLKC